MLPCVLVNLAIAPRSTLMNRRLLPLALFAAAALVAALGQPTFAGKDKKAPEVPPRKGKSETIKLFNGKDLDGWEGYEDLWSVKDGVIVAKNTKPIKVSTYLLTKRKFSDFRLVFSAKLRRVGDALRRRLLGQEVRPEVPGVKDPQGRTRRVHLPGPSGDVPVGLGPVRPLSPRRVPSIRRGDSQRRHEGRQAARLERHGDPRPGQPHPPGRQRQAGARLARSGARARQGRPDRPAAPLEQRAAGGPLQGAGADHVPRRQADRR